MDRFKYELGTLLLLLLFIWVIPTVGNEMVKNGYDFNKLGPYGDFIAGTTVPLLTFISFLAIVVTLKMQKEQISMQSEELKNSIEEMKATRVEFEIQNKTLAFQRFESTFFQMINLHNNIVESVSSMGETKKVGRAAFLPIYYSFESCYKRKLNKHEFENKEELERIRMAYVKFFELYEPQLGHYFRNLYRIVKFIDEATVLNFDEKKNYIGIIKAQLSSYELALLLYNGLSSYGRNFLPLMEKYNLLDNLNHTILVLSDSHLQVYNNEAGRYINNV